MMIAIDHPGIERLVPQQPNIKNDSKNSFYRTRPFGCVGVLSGIKVEYN